MKSGIEFQNFLNREIEEINKSREGKVFNDFRPGDTISVVYNLMQDDEVKEGDKVEWRTQTLTGICMRKHNNSFSSTFTVKKIKDKASSVKRTFLLYSPMIQSIKLDRKGLVRRAKLNYLNTLYGKAARIKERREAKK